MENPEQTMLSMREHAGVIGEIHHRLTNSLQVLNSLLGLQAHRTNHAELAHTLRETQNRIRAITSIYDPLYSVADFSTVHFGLYLEKLARELESFYELGPRVTLQITAADMALDADLALPLAIISNELISNAFKHAFGINQNGKVLVRLQYLAQPTQDEEEEFAKLEVEDNGVGLPSDIDLITAESLGLYLVRILTQQLRGTVGSDCISGTSIRVSFPLTSHKAPAQRTAALAR